MSEKCIGCPYYYDEYDAERGEIRFYCHFEGMYAPCDFSDEEPDIEED